MPWTFFSASCLVAGLIQPIACTRRAKAALMLSTMPLDLRLGRGREIFVDIGLADRVLRARCWSR